MVAKSSRPVAPIRGVDHGLEARERGASPRAQLGEREDVATAVGFALHQNEARDLDLGALAVELEPVTLYAADLGQLLRVLDETDTRLGVREDVAALVRKIGLIDRNRDATRRIDREIGVDPLRSGPGQDGDLVPRREAAVDQPGGDLADRDRHVVPRDLTPCSVPLDAGSAVGSTSAPRDRRTSRRDCDRSCPTHPRRTSSRRYRPPDASPEDSCSVTRPTI